MYSSIYVNYVSESCYRDGRAYKTGVVIQNNCNKCNCEYIAGRYDWRCTDEPCLIRPELIEEINDGPYTWKAANYSDLWGLTLDEGTRYRLGTFPPDSIVSRMNPIRGFKESLPEKFDSREKWPNMISPVTDQGNCGSSWAHTTAALASDRLNIQSNGALDDVLSVQHLLSCDDRQSQDGCQGGSVDRAWWFMRKHGVVSEKCYPYTTTHHNNPRECLIPANETFGECPSKAEFKRGKRFRATPPYKLLSEETEIMKEILVNGPVQAIFQVREDFFMYKTGVYRYTNLIGRTGDPEKYMKSGFHSVRIVG
ncbi:Tubulointerstitial nephritis antigen-like [Bulinus truncatus]|nr:Tubulointerstitial nephritis antigen-like [Bulinus truncatus]